ncbi:magnesium transport protein CorA [Planctomycetia bacterium]|nr:magnesium transport protein CorA [Planctomycetia bacterium]
MSDDSSLLPVDPPFRRQTKPGAAPGTFLPPLDAAPTRITVISYSPTEIHEAELTDVGKLDEFLSHWPVTWVNVEGLADVGQLETLADLFGIHPLAMEDVVHVHQRPKVEDYGQYLFIVTRMIEDADPLRTDQTSIFLGKKFLLTIQERPGDCLNPLRERLRKHAGRLRHAGPDYLAYAILDATLDAYFPLVEKYGDRMEQLDDAIANAPSPRIVSELHRLRTNLLQVRKTMWAQRDSLLELIRDDSAFVAQETRVYLRDCVDHTAQILDVVETYREMCADLRDYYLSQNSFKMNQVIKVLTILSTIFLPLGFITGLYGMNFDHQNGHAPWNMPELRWFYGYPFALGLMAATTAGLLVYMQRRGWLDS